MAVPRRHVLIIGGGLAGPCLALSLARRNIRSTIFEIRPTRSDSGGSISLGPNALQVLDRYAGVYGAIKAGGFTYRRMGAYIDTGEKYGEIAVGEEDKGAYGYPSVRLMRSSIHKILLDAAQEEEDLINVKMGARLREIKENEQGVTALFEDGSEAHGDLLIGADGVHSQVRKHILGPQAPNPTFDGLAIIYGFLPASSAIRPSPEFTFPAFMFTSSGLFMTVPIDAAGKTLAWVINRPMGEYLSREEWKQLERSGEGVRLAKADYDEVHVEPVRSLLDNAKDEDARVWAAYSIPDLPTWHTSKVCLIGDAAHGLPPNGGQGSAMAFEDAAILTRLLDSGEDHGYEDLFARFESIRRPRIAKLRETSKTGGALKTKTGPWGWYFKKWAFWAFFKWNKGVLNHHKEFVYDVDKVDISS